jgi:hypothetical protein
VFKFHDGTAVRTILTDNSTIPVSKGGSGLTAIGDDELILGDGADTTKRAVLPSCSNATTSKLLYDNTTETFSCGTDQTGGGGGAPTTATYVVTSADGTLSNEVVLPTCSGTDKLTFNGTTISCATDQNTGGGGSGLKFKCAEVPASDTLSATTGDFATTCSLPANTLAVGDIIEIRIAGIATNSSGSAQQMKYAARVGANTIYGDSSQTLANNQTNRPWFQTITCAVSAIGASASITCAGINTGPTSGGVSLVYTAEPPAITFDSTAITTWGASQFGSSAASTSSQLKLITMEVK